MFRSFKTAAKTVAKVGLFGGSVTTGYGVAMANEMGRQREQLEKEHPGFTVHFEYQSLPGVGGRLKPVLERKSGEPTASSKP